MFERLFDRTPKRTSAKETRPVRLASSLILSGALLLSLVPIVAAQEQVLRQSSLGGLPRTLHPYPETQAYTAPWNTEAVMVWRSLLSIDYNTLQHQAGPNDMAAALPDVSPDGRTYTFTLRDDIVWSDGTPITSADFQFAWENASLTENNWVGLSSTIARIATFETPDPSTVMVTLKEQLAPFLALNIMADIRPVPSHVWAGRSWVDPVDNPEILMPTVVSGPYAPYEISAEQHAFAWNPSWWGQQPYLDEIILVGSNPQTALELLRTQQVQWTENFPPAQYVLALDIPTAYVVQWSGATGLYRTLEFNLNRPHTSDKRFREAIARMIDRDDIVDFEEGLAVQQYGLQTQNSRWRNDAVERYDYNVELARQLLADAGYTLQGGTLYDTTGMPVVLDLAVTTTSQPRVKFGAYLQQQLRPLGIEVMVTALEFNAYLEKVYNQGDYDLNSGAWGATLDPDSLKSLYATDGTQNAFGYSNPSVDVLFALGAREQDPDLRRQIYDEIQRAILDDLVAWPMVTLTNYTAFDNSVQGVEVATGAGGGFMYQNNDNFLNWYIAQ